MSAIFHKFHSGITITESITDMRVISGTEPLAHFAKTHEGSTIRYLMESLVSHVVLTRHHKNLGLVTTEHQ
jgi:hypothetical protein